VTIIFNEIRNAHGGKLKVVPYGPLDIHRHFGGPAAYIFKAEEYSALKMELENSPETSKNFYQAIRLNIPESVNSLLNFVPQCTIDSNNTLLNV
jgi:hypothetical protein